MEFKFRENIVGKNIAKETLPDPIAEARFSSKTKIGLVDMPMHKARIIFKMYMRNVGPKAKVRFPITAIPGIAQTCTDRAELIGRPFMQADRMAFFVEIGRVYPKFPMDLIPRVRKMKRGFHCTARPAIAINFLEFAFDRKIGAATHLPIHVEGIGVRSYKQKLKKQDREE